MKRVCSKCGAENLVDAKYCQNCGVELSESTNDLHNKESQKSGKWRFINSLWIGFTFTLGFLNWMSFLYVGIHVRRIKWIICAIIYAIPITFGLLSTSHGPFPNKFILNFSALLILFMGVISIIHAFMIRNEYLIRLEVKSEIDQNRHDELVRLRENENSFRAVSDGKKINDLNYNNEKFNKMIKNSGILTIGLGVFLSLFSLFGGLVTIFFGVLLLLVKKVEILLIVGAIIISFGFYNLATANFYGVIQILMAVTFFYSFYKYSNLITWG